MQICDFNTISTLMTLKSVLLVKIHSFILDFSNCQLLHLNDGYYGLNMSPKVHVWKLDPLYDWCWEVGPEGHGETHLWMIDVIIPGVSLLSWMWISYEKTFAPFILSCMRKNISVSDHGMTQHKDPHQKPTFSCWTSQTPRSLANKFLSITNYPFAIFSYSIRDRQMSINI